MIAALVFWGSVGTIAWIYVGYPAALAGLGRLRPRPRERARVQVPISVVIAAHNEDAIITAKIDNIRASTYPSNLIEIIIASDGSDDRTVELARRAGANVVIDLPRVGKLQALNAAVDRSSGEILVLTDADSSLPHETLDELLSNFADRRVGAVAAREVHVANGSNGVGRGEGLYWRYEQRLKQLEDRVGSTVSASGRLYAMRRNLFVPSNHRAGADDVVLSTQVIAARRRLAFDARALVFVAAPSEGGTELFRKVRMMNQGLRATLALMLRLSPVRHAPYLAQLLLHKVLRRFVGFLLVAALAATIAATMRGGGRWWMLALAAQLAFYTLAVSGALLDHRRLPVPRALWVSYYFCLSNLAAALAVLSLLRGTRFEMWEPTSARAQAGTPEPAA